jgi:hypothetical protein
LIAGRFSTQFSFESPKQLHNSTQRRCLVIFVFSDQPSIGGVMHVLWPAPARPLKDTRGPVQTFPHLLSFAHGPVAPAFTLGWIGQLVTVPAGKDRAAVENRGTPSAALRWTQESSPCAAKVTGGPVDLHRIADILPVATVFPCAIIQDNVVSRRRDADISPWVSIYRP